MSCYPFPAVVGQAAAKEALLLALTNPRIGGVLINGEKGSCKSTLVRAAAETAQIKLTELPLSASEDRMLGTIDLEKTLQTGVLSVESGLLAQADGGYLYMDDVNLLQDAQTDVLIQVSSEHALRVEREGMSYTQPCRIAMIGTMNEAEGTVRPQLLDRFGLYVKMDHCDSEQERVEIIKRRLAFETAGAAFCASFQTEQAELRAILAEAKNALERIPVTQENIAAVVQKCLEAAVEGHRADLIMLETARTAAALHGHVRIEPEDIEEAAYFVLPHRRRELPPMPEEEQEPEEQEEQDHDHDHDEEPEQDESEQQEPTEQSQQQREEPQDAPPPETDSSDDGKGKDSPLTQTFAVGDPFKVIAFGHGKDRKLHRGSGRRTTVKTVRKSGRYIGARQNRTNNDLALDATIRAAAPHQLHRDRSEVAIAIQSQDIREKVRERRLSNLLVFVVDASGSMGAQKRMTEAKAAVLSLLRDAYVRRDQVCMVTFRGQEAQVILPPTSSTERGYTLLQKMETGGRTPLNAGLEKGLEVVQSGLRKDPDILPMMIVITDGRGNVSIAEGKKPLEEMDQIAEKIRGVTALDTMVIDIERGGLMHFGLAKRLADQMNSQYYQMEQLKAGALLEQVRGSAHHE